MTKKHPADEFLEDAREKRAARRQQELTWLERWRESQDPEHLEPLLKAYEPVLASAVRYYVPGTVNQQAALAEAQRLAVTAFRTYDPSKAALNTHVTNQMPKLQRFANRHQNVGYMPEAQTGRIGDIQRTRDRLTEDYGYAPSPDEIGRALKKPLSGKRVAQILGGMRRDIPASAFEDDPDEKSLSHDHQVLSLLRYSLPPAEKELFHLLHGLDEEGQPARDPVTSTKDLAKHLGKSESQVSRLKTNIVTAYQQYTKRRA